MSKQEGHTVKSVSTLEDADGKTKQKWTKTVVSKQAPEELLKRYLKELPSLVPPREKLQLESAELLTDDMVAIYPIGDAHVGMLAWHEETGDDNNVEIIKHRLGAAMRHLVAQGPPTKSALVINLGDFFHSDNNAGVTARSGNSLDTDTRWSKTIRSGLTIMVGMIEVALQRHEFVRVINEIGNHDDHSSIFLGVALDAYYKDENRVSIDMSPAKFHYARVGDCLIGVTHGDTVKLADLESIMSVDKPKDWGETVHRYWYTGHIHHAKKQEYRGCIVEAFRTLAGRDAWHAAQGYRSGQDMTKIHMHRKYGEVYRATYNASFLAHST